MPWVNYCKKCKQEVPIGESCPKCYGKLTKTGEYLSFALIRTPARDWFSWNQVLRVALPALLIVAAVTLGAEGALSGGRGIQALFLQGFLGTLVGVLLSMLLVMLILLLVQGKETVHFVLDKNGIRAYTYLYRPSTIRLFARFSTWETVKNIQKDEAPIENYVLVKRVEVLWIDIRRIRFWKEDKRILLFKPSWWQTLVVTCPAVEYGEAEAFLRKKLARNKTIKIVPPTPKGRAKK